jgi:cobalt/nickel transport system ATP-binding protein
MKVNETVLEIQGLSFHYPDGMEALKGVNLKLCKFERVAVIGPNGAGKSTLFFHLNGIFRGTGEIRVLGQLMDNSTLHAIRRQVGLVFQDPDDQLFMPTVFEDVAFGPVNLGLSEAQVRDRVRTALHWVGMEGSEALVPHHLSVGQKKKIALATVLSMDAKILAFDEPSTGLDPRSRRSLIELLKKLPQPQLIATHDLDLTLEVCSRAVLMDGGRVIADGSIPDIYEDKALLEAHGLEQPRSWAARAEDAS